MKIEGHDHTVLLDRSVLTSHGIEGLAAEDQVLSDEIRKLRENVGQLHHGLAIVLPPLIESVTKLADAFSQMKDK